VPRAPHHCPGDNGRCLERIPAEQRYCDEHRRQVAWLKTTGDERPDTGRAEHRRIRDAVLARDGHICQLQYDKCEQVAVEMDHIVAKVDGGQTTVENGRSACRSCHKKRTNSQATAASAAARRGGYATDPAVRAAIEQEREQRKTARPAQETWDPARAVIRSRPRW
jgi:5-methylcytosine-specific restriction enzyme A